MKVLDSRIIENISSAALFKKIPLMELEKILERSQIKSFKKNEVIFLKSNKASNLYFAVSGLIKTSITNYDGEEMIIEISDHQQILNQIFEDSFSFDCKAVEDCKIILIPLINFRKNLEENSQIAFNAMVEMSSKNSLLINRLEQFKLLSAEEKIGEFLLNSSFERKKKRRNFKLNLSKSLIASYLGIKSETLSRAFKKLIESESISLNKNHIKLPNESSLCKFCNDKISKNCNDKNSHFCQNSP